MKKLIRLSIVVILFINISSCAKSDHELIELEGLSPWCIIDFDSLDRTPEQRIAMLKEMGFKKYGFNRGKGDLDEMKKEFKLARESDIEISSIFLWLNAKRDSVGKLSPSNQVLLNNLKKIEQKPAIWLSFSHNFFDELNQKESVDLSIEMIRFIKLKADEVGCKLALYNHHGWFGNPHNQIQILEELRTDSITMVYNFHHAQEYVDEFPEIARKIKPYLSYVNLNGVKKEGPQILTIGEGDYEYDMIKLLKKEGFNGPWGILGHIKNKDVQVVLEQNMKGLKLLNSKFNKEEGK
ncbi:sugar phosphate isomerase/epimerase family protein [Carboxylicivirga sp. N1Y90]|uniref:sugar phosphate isomerase/epimerase family protein n=1 Tax=Carboxylicivirga fragile TaxID=3417571 RepID=UPI003D352031|nr:TIM barrel protein [Marinilabiliaceae bacterium N1Y90]